MMEMWLKRSTLVFLTVAVAAIGLSDQAPVILNETQSTVHIPFGSPLTFHCCVRTLMAGHKPTDRLLVQWYFNPHESSFNESHKLHEERSNKSASTSTNKTQTLWNYTLPYATEQNSGWYFCKVTEVIPRLNFSKSSGTHVVITMTMEHTTHLSLPIVTDKQATVSPPENVSLDQWLWTTLGVSAVILIVLLAICALMRRRCRRSRAEDPVYANTRPVAKQPSPRPGMPVDNLKMASSPQIRNPSPGRRYDEGKLRYKE